MSEPDGAEPAAPEISVVICSYSGAETLPVALRSIWEQTLRLDQLELIVVDDGSTDATAAVALDHGARVLSLGENVGLAAARNAGVEAARAPIVAFTDDDCRAAPDWAERLLEAFADPKVLGAGGSVTPEAEGRFMQRYLRDRNPLVPLGAELTLSNAYSYRFGLYLRRTLNGHSPPPRHLYSVVGANMAFRREALLELGGFDEAFRFGSEEEDLCRRLHARFGPERLVYVDEAVVIHRFRNSVGDALRRARAYGRGNARNVLKHPAMRPIVFPVPLIVLAILLRAVSRRDVRMALAAGLLPLLAYPDWARRMGGTPSPDALAYPYIQAGQEMATMLGELEGLRTGYLRDRVNRV